MGKLKYKILAFLNVMWMILIPLVIANGIFYLLGSFIALDFNPYHWWAFTTTFGRILMVIVEVSILVNIPTWWEQFNK
jgi:hypothetical protein